MRTVMNQNVTSRIEGVNEALAEFKAPFQVYPVNVVKPNHELSGFSTVPFANDNQMHPVVYWDNSFETLSDRELAGHIIHVYLDESKTLDAGFEDYFSREYILNHVLPKVLCRDTNEEAVRDSELPFILIPNTDLIACFYMTVSNNATVQLNRMLLEQAGIIDEELFAHAKENILREMKITSMAQMMAELAGLPFPVEQDEMPLFIVTKHDGKFGSGIIMAGFDVFRRIGEVLKTDSFYLLPSSIHEVLALPASNSPFGDEELVNMVSEINASVVAPEDILTDNVYRVDLKNGTFTQCR